MSKGNIEKFPIRAGQRELNRRGNMSLSCIVTDRWIRFGAPDWGAVKAGSPIEIDVMSANSPSNNGDRKICSLIITVEQLRNLLANIEKHEGNGDQS